MRYQHVFAFPHWRAQRMCWRCGDTPTGRCSYTNCNLDAPWRSTRTSAEQTMVETSSMVRRTTLFFACSSFSVDMVVIGVLHCMYLGVTTEALGNIMWEFMETLPGHINAKVKKNTLGQSQAVVQRQPYQNTTTKTDQRHDQYEWQISKVEIQGC